MIRDGDIGLLDVSSYICIWLSAPFSLFPFSCHQSQPPRKYLLLSLDSILPQWLLTPPCMAVMVTIMAHLWICYFIMATKKEIKQSRVCILPHPHIQCSVVQLLLQKVTVFISHHMTCGDGSMMYDIIDPCMRVAPNAYHTDVTLGTWHMSTSKVMDLWGLIWTAPYNTMYDCSHGYSKPKQCDTIGDLFHYIQFYWDTEFWLFITCKT